MFFISALVAGCGSNLESKKLTPISFTPVSLGPDTTPPSIVSASPANGATGVTTSAASLTIQVVFSEPMDPATVNASTFMLLDSTFMAVSGTVTYYDFFFWHIAEFHIDPPVDLNSLETYTVRVTTGVTDLAGNPLPADYSLIFTTASMGQVPAPQYDIMPGTYDTPISVQITCADPMADIWYTIDGSSPIPGVSPLYTGMPINIYMNTVLRSIATRNHWSDSAITSGTYNIRAVAPGFTPPARLYPSGQNITIQSTTPGSTIRYTTDGTNPKTSPTAIDGLPGSGNASVMLSANTTIRTYAYAPFLTDSHETSAVYTIDGTYPFVAMTTHASGDRDVSPSSTIAIIFSEVMNPATITTNVGSSACTGSLQVSFVNFTTCVQMSAPPNTTDNVPFTLTPSAALATGTVYKVKVLGSVQDSVGNPMGTDYTSSNGFITEINGSIDNGFGGGGYQTIHLDIGFFDDEGNSLLILPDGSIVAGGDSEVSGTYDFIASKLHPDGTFDTFFGLNGINSIVALDNDCNTGAGFQPTRDRIILSGSNIDTTTFFLAALKNADGSLDLSFGSGGTTTIDVSSLEFGSHTNDFANALAIDSSERIIIAGVTGTPSDLNDMAIVRLEPNGPLDTTFGGNGIVTTNFGLNRNESAMAVAIQSDGKIVAAGYHYKGAYNNFAIARFNNDGSPDISFGTNGITSIDLGVNSVANAIAIQADGKIILAGYANDDFAIVRLMPNGTLDTSFDGDGILIHHLGGDDKAYAVAIQANGKILAAGISDNATAVTRYLPNGAIDATFGTGCVVMLSIGSATISTSSMKIQPSDGRIVICWTCNTTSNAYEMYVIRLK